MRIEKISASDTWPLRHIVMWPEKPLEFVQLPEDHEGSHYGLFEENELISVISLFLKDDQLQFRKFATRIDKQGLGFGTKLLSHVIAEADQSGAKSIWCNAREEKCMFYEKFGLKKTERRFTKAGKDYVIMERIILK